MAIEYKGLNTFILLMNARHAGYYRASAISYYYEFKDTYKTLKREIVENLINLNEDQKRGYFEKIKYEFIEGFDVSLGEYSKEMEYNEQLYQGILKKFDISPLPINELGADLMRYINTHQEFYEFMNFEYDHQEIAFMEDQRREKGGGSWFSEFQDFFYTINTQTIFFFLNELTVFIRELEIKYNLVSSYSGSEKDELPNVVTQQDNQKILLLFEIGVIDFLDKKFSLNGNNRRLAQILHPITDINSDTIRKTIEGYKNDTKNNPLNKNEEWLTNTMSALKLKIEK